MLYRYEANEHGVDNWRMCGKMCLEWGLQCKYWSFYAPIRGKGKSKGHCTLYKSCKPIEKNWEAADKAYYYSGDRNCPAGALLSHLMVYHEHHKCLKQNT